ncbi:HAD-IIIA family hydrolase [Candidatus Woesearchaeota archaeon]|nr:HAD-IIIA family hydrolase [Candidatus Woesearchaeota archaeon]
MVQIKQAVILAGGMGTRLKPITDTIPKPMILMNGKPFLEYLLGMLKENGIEEVVLLLGYLPEKICDYFGDGSKFGLRIKYSIGEVSFETGKRIKFAEELMGDNFLLMYCDNYWPLNLNNLVEYHNKHDVLATVTIYTNKDNFSKSNMKVDEQGYVVLYDKSRQEKNLSGVEIGFYILSKDIFRMMPETNFSFEKKIIPELIEKKQLAGYLTDHRYYSVGSLERLPITEDFLRQKKVIFLDRDGVINKKAPKADYVKKWAEFEFLPGSIEAMKKLTDEGFEIYIISNQPGMARGMMTEKDLRDITNNMMKLLENKGIKIKKVYYCTHSWDDGCECRKPKPGMFYQAGRENNLNLSKAIFIGDDERDVTAGEAAGIRTILVTSEKSLLDVVKEIVNT